MEIRGRRVKRATWRSVGNEIFLNDLFIGYMPPSREQKGDMERLSAPHDDYSERVDVAAYLA